MTSEEDRFRTTVSRLVYEELGASLPQAKTRGMCLLDVSKSEAERERSIDSQVAFLMAQLWTYYGLTDRRDIKTVDFAVRRAAFKVSKMLRPPKAHESAQLKGFRAAFSTPYVGDAHLKFYRYLKRCWNAYKLNWTDYISPYGTLLQSSGSGKSRMLYEVAKLAAGKSSRVQMRLLYLCARGEKASGFPLATPTLCKWFFEETYSEWSMKTRLLRAFNYADTNWDAVGTEWLDLFTEEAADQQVAENLDRTKPVEVSYTSEEEEEATSEASEEAANASRLLVLVVDEASLMLDSTEPHRNSRFHALRRALVRANNRLRQADRGGGIFAVLVDSNPSVYTDLKIRDFTPRPEPNPSSRSFIHEQQMILFPPFVLTHTRDVFWPKPADYKASVVQDDAKKQWNALVSMGRPVWKTFIEESAWIGRQQQELSDLAVSKLLRGFYPGVKENYTEETMFGVMVLLCRLGLRPLSSSALSTRAVADFMGTLNYVTFTNDNHISSYPSEPVLAFGATRLWYQLGSTSLERFLLPRFHELLMQRVVDVGNIGEVVARVFLLLAMDEAIFTCRSKDYERQKKGNFIFAGQFCTVRQFLDVLDKPPQQNESHPILRTDSNSTPSAGQKAAFEAWMKKWEGWSVGFSHFEDLPEEPTEETLWLLLGRRAAGVLQRKHKETELVIPMFSKRGGDGVASFIVVQIVDRGQDSRAMEDTMRRDTIRLYLHLEEGASPEHPAQMYTVESTRAQRQKLGDGATTQGKTFALHLRGVCELSNCGDVTTTPWSFLSLGIWAWLEKIVKSAWLDVTERVLSDLSRRKGTRFEKQSKVLSKEDVMEAVVKCITIVPNES